jgi:HEAT repeat protein
MRSLQILILLPLLVTLPAARAGEPTRADDPDERLLDEAGVGSDDDDLLAFLNESSAVPLSGLAALVRRLGSDDFAAREEASRRLIACGPKALPYLRPAAGDKDAEIAYRANACIAAINRPGRRAAPAAVARLLARRHPDDAVEALLRFLPYAADGETEEQVWLALDALALDRSTSDPLLLPALKDEDPARRAFAACWCGQAHDADTRAAARRLLEDADPLVRLRAAQGLLSRRDRAALPALIGLLETSPVALAWQAEELLHWAAAGTGPSEVIGTGGLGWRVGCRAAWQRWWEKHGSRRDPEDFGRGVPPPGLFLVAVADLPYRLTLRGCDGTPRWRLGKIDRPSDVRLLDGERLLLATAGPTGDVTERDLGGKLLWRVKVSGVQSCVRLPDGNTFLTCARGPLEVTPAGKFVYRTADRPDLQPLFDAGPAWRMGNGRLGVVRERGQNGLVLDEVDPTAEKCMRSSRFLPGWGQRWRLLDTLPAGGLLVAHGDHLCALDSRYRSTWERRLDVSSASQWPDGRTIAVGSWGDGDLLTVIDHRGRQVWEEVFPCGHGPCLVRCCLGLVRIGFTGRGNDDDLDDPEVCARGLRHKDGLVRLRTVTTLRGLGRRAALAVPDLLGACDDPDGRVRDAAWAALAGLAPHGREALAGALGDHRPAVRAAGAGLLVLAGSPEQLLDHVPVLRKALKDGDGRVRLAAAATLAEVVPNEPGVVPVLEGAVEDHALAPASRALAARALARLGSRAVSAVPALERARADLGATRGAFEDWLEVSRARSLLRAIAEAKGSSAEGRRDALRGLAILGNYAAPAVPVALEGLQDRDPGVRREAAECLGRIGPVLVVVPALVEVLDGPGDDALRASVALALGEIGPSAEAAVPALVALLKRPEGGDSEAAITRRANAARALAAIGPAARAARPALERAARDDSSDRVRRQAQDAVRRIGDR